MTTTEQVRLLEAQAKELSILLRLAWEQEVEGTRVLPDDARSALLEFFFDAMEPGKLSEIKEEMMSSYYWLRGYNESTDQHLLREWFEIECGHYEDITDILDSPFWKEHFANNLGVAAVLGTWLNEKKWAAETITGEVA